MSSHAIPVLEDINPVDCFNGRTDRFECLLCKSWDFSSPRLLSNHYVEFHRIRFAAYCQFCRLGFPNVECSLKHEKICAPPQPENLRTRDVVSVSLPCQTDGRQVLVTFDGSGRKVAPSSFSSSVNLQSSRRSRSPITFNRNVGCGTRPYDLRERTSSANQTTKGRSSSPIVTHDHNGRTQKRERSRSKSRSSSRKRSRKPIVWDPNGNEKTDKKTRKNSQNNNSKTESNRVQNEEFEMYEKSKQKRSLERKEDLEERLRKKNKTPIIFDLNASSSSSGLHVTPVVRKCPWDSLNGGSIKVSSASSSPSGSHSSVGSTFATVPVCLKGKHVESPVQIPELGGIVEPKTVLAVLEKSHKERLDELEKRKGIDSLETTPLVNGGSDDGKGGVGNQPNGSADSAIVEKTEEIEVEVSNKQIGSLAMISSIRGVSTSEKVAVSANQMKGSHVNGTVGKNQEEVKDSEVSSEVTFGNKPDEASFSKNVPSCIVVNEGENMDSKGSKRNGLFIGRFDEQEVSKFSDIGVESDTGNDGQNLGEEIRPNIDSDDHERKDLGVVALVQENPLDKTVQVDSVDNSHIESHGSKTSASKFREATLVDKDSKIKQAEKTKNSKVCPVCKVRFTNKNKLQNHITKTHPFSCPVCFEDFTSESECDAHLEKIHFWTTKMVGNRLVKMRQLRIEPPRCPVCFFDAVEWSNIEHHWTNNHQGGYKNGDNVEVEGSFNRGKGDECPEFQPCFVCHLGTNTEDHFKKFHRLTCRVCLRRFIHAEAVSQHFRSAHGKWVEQVWIGEKDAWPKDFKTKKPCCKFCTEGKFNTWFDVQVHQERKHVDLLTLQESKGTESGGMDGERNDCPSPSCKKNNNDVGLRYMAHDLTKKHLAVESEQASCENKDSSGEMGEEKVKNVDAKEEKKEGEVEEKEDTEGIQIVDSVK